MRAEMLWDIFFKRIDAQSHGNVSINDFTVLFNDEQLGYFRECIGGSGSYVQGNPRSSQSPDSGTRAINKLAPFIVNRVVPVTNNIFKYRFEGFEHGPTVYAPGYVNPDSCGDEPQHEYDIPLEMKTEQEWGRSTRSTYRPPTLEYPIFRIIDRENAEAAPRGYNYLKVRYYRRPNDIYIETTPNGMHRQPNGAHIDPEWSDADCIHILDRVMSAVSIREQEQAWNKERREADR